MRRLWIPLILLGVFLLQCAWFLRTQSLTFDEPFHTVAGLEAWRHSMFKDYDNDPPLAPRLFTLLVPRDWHIEYRFGYPVEVIQPEPTTFFRRVRPVNVALGIVLAVLLWVATRRLYSEGAANFALALFVLSPGLIAHFSIATLDGVGTLMIFATVLQVAAWRANPSRARTAMTGVLLGLLLLAKHNAPPMFALAWLVVLVSSPDGIHRRVRQWNWGKAALIFVIAAFVVWAGYSFNVSKVEIHDGQATVTFPNFPWPLVKPVPFSGRATLYFPAAEYLTGIHRVVQDSRTGVINSYFFGEVSDKGRVSYFPTAIVLKWPTIILLLALGGLLLILSRRLSPPRDLRWMMLFPALYFLPALTSNMNQGDRHVLPTYPFLLLLAAATWEWARSRKMLVVLLYAALALQAADTLRYAPDYLSYFNPFVKSEESWRMLADSSLDWGQGLLALRQYEAEHPQETIYLAYFGNVVPQKVYGIRALPLEPGKHVSGTVIVSASQLAGHRLQNPAAYRWVLQYPRKAILNHTLHVFEVPPEAVSPPPK